jgi:DNA-binding transcriptional regulator/RsmH inhibitor MraZ
MAAIRSPAFSGAYPLKIDPKNRLQIPHQFRKRLDALIHGTTYAGRLGRIPRTIELIPEKIYDETTALAMNLDRLPVSQYRSLLTLNSVTYWMEQDAQGRVLLDRQLLSKAGFVAQDQEEVQIRDVVLIGMFNHLVLMSAADREQMERETLTDINEVRETTAEALEKLAATQRVERE